MTTEKISELFDAQLDELEVRKQLDALAGDAGLRDRFTFYGLIGDVLRGNSTPDDGFTQRILRRMDKEGVQIEPGYDPLAD